MRKLRPTSKERALLGVVTTLVFVFVLAAAIVFFVFLPKINATSGNVNMIEGNLQVLEDRVDDIEVSIVTTPPPPAKNAPARGASDRDGTILGTDGGAPVVLSQHGVRSGGNTTPPATLPLPPGYIVYHTANCFYQDGDPLQLNHLDDVDLQTVVPVPGNVLGLDASGKWMPTSGPGVSSINDLGDVTIVAPAAGQALVYVGPDWMNGVLGASGVDSAQIQLRVTGTCPAGSQISSIGVGGTVVCDNTVDVNTISTAQVVDGSLVIGDMDASSVQARVTGTCPAGSQVASISVGGAVTCDSTVAPNTINSAQIVDGTIVAADVDATSVQVRVTGTCPAGSQVASIDSGGGVTCDSTVAASSVGSAQIIDGSIAEVDMTSPYARGVALGVATLDAGGMVPLSQLPTIPPAGTVTVCADIPCRDALTPNVGDIVKVLDRGDGSPETYVWDGKSF